MDQNCNLTRDLNQKKRIMVYFLPKFMITCQMQFWSTFELIECATLSQIRFKIRYWISSNNFLDQDPDPRYTIVLLSDDRLLSVQWSWFLGSRIDCRIWISWIRTRRWWLDIILWSDCRTRYQLYEADCHSWSSKRSDYGGFSRWLSRKIWRLHSTWVDSC